MLCCFKQTKDTIPDLTFMAFLETNQDSERCKAIWFGDGLSKTSISGQKIIIFRCNHLDRHLYFKHEYLRSRAYICLSLSSPFSLVIISQIWPLSRYSCCYLGSLYPRNLLNQFLLVIRVIGSFFLFSTFSYFRNFLT